MDKNREAKKEQFSATNDGSPAIKIIICLVVLLAVGAGGYFAFFQTEASAVPLVKSVAGEVRLDLKNISDGQAHFYRYASERGEISFFVVKSVDGVMRAAFDACDVCYKAKKGYSQEGDMMICNNCDMRFRTDLINVVKGGCNPAPLNRKVEGGQLVINHKDILQGARYFGG